MFRGRMRASGPRAPESQPNFWGSVGRHRDRLPEPIAGSRAWDPTQPESGPCGLDRGRDAERQPLADRAGSPARVAGLAMFADGAGGSKGFSSTRTAASSPAVALG